VAPIIEGRRWLEDRLRFLQAELDRTADPADRRGIEAEIERVNQELGRHKSGWRRWWIFGGRLPRG